MKGEKDLKIRDRLKNRFIQAVGIASIAGVLGLILLFVVDAQYSTALVDNGFIQGDIGEYCCAPFSLTYN